MVKLETLSSEGDFNIFHEYVLFEVFRNHQALRVSRTLVFMRSSTGAFASFGAELEPSLRDMTQAQDPNQL